MRRQTDRTAVRLTEEQKSCLWEKYTIFSIRSTEKI